MSDQIVQDLNGLLSAVLAGNAFYSQRLHAAGVRSEVSCLEEFQTMVPFTTKTDLVLDQQDLPPYGSNHTQPLYRYTRFCQTSGTTGKPLFILDTPESWDALLENWFHIYKAAELVQGDCIYFAFSFGPFLGFWTAFEAATQCGLRSIPGGGLTTSARLRAMRDHRAAVLCCTPTYALHMAEVAASEGLAPDAFFIRKIIVAGEPGGSNPEVRARISSLWNGAEVLDHYGMTETGPVAYQRLGEPGFLHIIESAYLAEIIDPECGRPVPTGERGELVLTTLTRQAAPLLRYRTGDLACRSSEHEGFVLAGGILGRVDEMVVIRGVNVYPAGLDSIIRAFPEIIEYRVTLRKRGELSDLDIEIEPTPGSEDVASRLDRALQTALSLRLRIEVSQPGALPRFEHKARRWIQTQES